jgi:hypothetical protein
MYDNYTAERPNAPRPVPYLSKHKCRHCGYYYESKKDLDLHKRIVRQSAEHGARDFFSKNHDWGLKV